MIDFSDHRVIAITVGLSIAVTSLIIIFIRFLVRQHKRKKQKNSDEAK